MTYTASKKFAQLQSEADEKYTEVREIARRLDNAQYIFGKNPTSKENRKHVIDLMTEYASSFGEYILLDEQLEATYESL